VTRGEKKLMLKLTYTENSFRLERLNDRLEDWVTTRVILALRSGTSIFVEPSTACFLLPASLNDLTLLEKLIREENGDIIAMSVVDADCVEVSLHGTWIESEPDGESGIFITRIDDRAELFLEKIWQEAQNLASLVND
jgi:hypothetical protein